MDAPIADSFWIEPGRVLAGAYPDGDGEIDALATAGITLIVDLTHADDGLPQYASTLRRLSVPIPDFGTPPLEELKRALDAIDAELAAGRAVYVHCLGGCGRTGTVVASWLVGQGATADAALERFSALAGRPCPERAAQNALVRAYAAARSGSNARD